MPIFEKFEEDAVIIAYHMSWPGAGDPYYTSEANFKRNFYGTNSAPSLFVNTTGTDIYSVSESTMQSDIDNGGDAPMQMELRFMLDPDNQSIRVKSRIKVLEDIPDGGHRLMIMLNEHKTFNNKETNGETEFHYVFKKMLPEATGELIIQTFSEGDIIEYDSTYVFQGDYRLPNSAQDEIDHDIEHSVEEFEDLYPVMMMHSLQDKRIYQAAVGEFCETMEEFDRPWCDEEPITPPTSIDELKSNSAFYVYPNPSNGLIRVEMIKEHDVQQIDLMTISGTVVKTAAVNAQNRIVDLDATDAASGVYLVKVVSKSGESIQRIIIE